MSDPIVNQKVRSSNVNATYDPAHLPTVAQLNAALGGRLSGQGQAFLTAGAAHGVNPAFLAAVAMAETFNGTSHQLANKNNVAGLYDGKHERYMTFPSVAASIDFAAKNLYKNYVSSGHVTPESVGRIYAPVGASNDPHSTNNQWPGLVRKRFNEIQGAGGPPMPPQSQPPPQVAQHQPRQGPPQPPPQRFRPEAPVLTGQLPTNNSLPSLPNPPPEAAPQFQPPPSHFSTNDLQPVAYYPQRISVSPQASPSNQIPPHFTANFVDYGGIDANAVMNLGTAMADNNPAGIMSMGAPDSGYFNAPGSFDPGVGSGWVDQSGPLPPSPNFSPSSAYLGGGQGYNGSGQGTSPYGTQYGWGGYNPSMGNPYAASGNPYFPAGYTAPSSNPNSPLQPPAPSQYGWNGYDSTATGNPYFPAGQRPTEDIQPAYTDSTGFQLDDAGQWQTANAISDFGTQQGTFGVDWGYDANGNIERYDSSASAPSSNGPPPPPKLHPFPGATQNLSQRPVLQQHDWAGLVAPKHGILSSYKPLTMGMGAQTGYVVSGNPYNAGGGINYGALSGAMAGGNGGFFANSGGGALSAVSAQTGGGTDPNYAGTTIPSMWMPSIPWGVNGLQLPGLET